MNAEGGARIALIIPTCQAGAAFPSLLAEIDAQFLQPAYRLVVDSGSTDGTVTFAQEAGWQTWSISKDNFGHGKTRQQALARLREQGEIDFVIYLTQDVRLPDRESFARLLAAFDDMEVAAAYGRQLPHKGASFYAAVDREFNYPDKSCVKSLTDAESLGIKTAFLSNSYAAYRVSDMEAQGGFRQVSICEDMDMAARFLLAGKKTAYVAEATVEHSHEPSFGQIWKRYREIGRFQRENIWLRENFGSGEGAGVKLVLYHLRRAWRERGLAGMMKIFALDLVKYLAYKTV